MMPFHRILFPFDFSEAATAMAPAVAAMARQFSASVTVLNAFHFAPDYVVSPRFDAASCSEPIAIPYIPAALELRNQREQRLEEFVREQLASIERKVRIEDGDPATVIEWVAKHEQSDLIMMPTRGLGRFRRLLLGSVTAKVLHDVECPVFTSTHEAEAVSSASRGYQSILCAVRLGPESDAALKMTGVLAEAWHARVCLLHIEVSSDTENTNNSVKSAQKAFQRTLEASGYSGADPRICILDAAILKGIRETAIDEKADLVIVGRGHLRGQISRAWSHVYTIIRESPCPVLSV
jgi:nucleotide-binding universal stress UspA family protein